MNITQKIKNWSRNKESWIFLIISVVSGINSLIFIAREVEQVEPLAILTSNKIYFIYGLILLSYLGLLTYIMRRTVNWQTFIGKTILTFLPTVVIWYWGFSQSIHFNELFYLSANLYSISTCFYILFKYKKYKNVSHFFKDILQKSAPSKQNRSSLVFPIILTAVLLLNFSFGSLYLTKYAAVDEPLWTQGRITKYWNNVFEGEFEKTMVSDKPGITVALISGIGLLWINPSDYKNPNWESIGLENFFDIEEMYLAFRAPIFLFNLLMLIVFYHLLKAILPRPASLLAVIFIGLSPLLLGISTIVNPDSLLWTFTPLSIISYFAYLKNGKNKFLYLSGIFLGLAILTKYVANVLYIYFFGLIFLEYIMNKKKYENIAVFDYFKKNIGDYLVIIFFSLLTFFLLLPQAWVDLETLFEGTIFSKAFIKIWPIFIAIIVFIILDMFIAKNKITAAILNFLAKYKILIARTFFGIFLLFVFLTLFDVFNGMTPYDLESIIASPKSSYMFNNLFGMALANFYSLIFGIIPIALAATLFIITKFLFKKKFAEENYRWTLYLVIFILIYYFGSIANNVSATVRYQIILYPIIFIISAIGTYEFINQRLIKKYLATESIYIIIIISSIYSLNFIRPFYFSYASDLLPKKYVLNLKDMGDGSYEAAQYLNKKPNAKELVIWTDKRGVCTFFIGKCLSGMGFKEKEISFDYFVVSSGREKRTTTMTLARYNGGNTQLIRLDKLYSEENPEYKLEIGERPNNFVKVIRGTQLKKYE